MGRGFRTRFVDSDHYVCSLKEPDRFCQDARNFLFVENKLDPCEAAILATVDGELVGFIRFGTYRRVVYALGTWVSRKHRGQGIAGWMWGRLLKKYPAYRIEVTTISRQGSRLVRALKQKYPRRNWAWCDISGKP